MTFNASVGILCFFSSFTSHNETKTLLKSDRISYILLEFHTQKMYNLNLGWNKKWNKIYWKFEIVIKIQIASSKWFWSLCDLLLHLIFLLSFLMHWINAVSNCGFPFSEILDFTLWNKAIIVISSWWEDSCGGKIHKPELSQR